MDAKSKAMFINSVAGGQGVPCPSCNNMNPPGSIFCRACGTRLQAEEPVEPEVVEEIEEAKEIICPVCNAVLTADAVFCFSCGTRVSGENVDIQDEEYAEADDEGSAYAEADNEKPAFGAADNDKPAFAAASNEKPAFVPVHKSASRRPAQKRVLNFALPEEETAVEVSVFAQGLPEWDVVPPQVIVRRAKKK